MAKSDEIDRLQRRLSWQAAGPLTEISNHATASLVAMLGALAQWIRQSGEERPLISLLLAFEAGFVIARLGSRRAKR
jgi:hypothetical protein